MNTSQNGLNFLAKQEGEVDHVYNDAAGIPTIGIGHRLHPGESFPNGITHEQAMTLLAQDVSVAEHSINAMVKVPLNQNQFDALVSFTFNCGGGALARSSILRCINAGDFDGAAAAFTQWDHAVEGGKLVVDEGLLNRRKAEAALFSTPVDVTFPIFPPA